MSIRFMTAAFHAANLNSAEKIVLLAISDCADDSGMCWPSLKNLADKSSMSPVGVSRVLTRLEEKGYISKKRRFRQSTIYSILTIGKLNPQLINPELKEVLTEGLKKSLPRVKREPSKNRQKNHQGEKVILPSWIPEETWACFCKHREQIKRPMTDQAEKLTLDKLKKLMETGSDPKEVLEQSIMNGWHGIFETKRETTRSPHRKVL